MCVCVCPPRALNLPINERVQLILNQSCKCGDKYACYQSIIPSQAWHFRGENTQQSTHSRILSMDLPLQYAGKVILIFDDETTFSRGTLIKYVNVSHFLFIFS